MNINYDFLYKQAAEYVNDQHRQLEKQFKEELSKIKFRGEITPEKIKRHGFKLINHQGVGLYITKKGIRVTDIFFRYNDGCYGINGINTQPLTDKTALKLIDTLQKPIKQ